MKADNIVVLKNGKVVQQGTHEGLMADQDGPYWTLASSQRLSMGDSLTNSLDLFDSEKQGADPLVSEKSSVAIIPDTSSEEQVRKPQSFRGSFGVFLWEQKHRWGWYSLMLLGALGAGGESSLSKLRAVVFLDSPIT